MVGLARLWQRMSHPQAQNPDLTRLLQKSQTATAKLRYTFFSLDASTEFYNNARARLDDNTLRISAIGAMIAPDSLSLAVLEAPRGSREAPQGRKWQMAVQKDNIYLMRDEYNGDVISKEKFLAFDDARLYTEAGIPQVNALIDLSLQKGILHDEGEE